VAKETEKMNGSSGNTVSSESKVHYSLGSQGAALEEFCREGGLASDKTYLCGTHRTAEPEETLRKTVPLMPAMGITRIANITGLDRIGLPVVLVTRPNSRSLAVSQGKGLSLNSAKASGLMESIEAFHAERPRVPLRLSTFEEIRYGEPVLNPQHFCSAASDFDSNRPILWTRGRDLISGRQQWVPFDQVHLNFAWAERTAASGLPITSNGLASGNHLLEAISHGICEVVERYAAGIWEADPSRGRRVDPSTIDDPDCRQLLDVLARSGLRTLIWNVTGSVELPCFYCHLIDANANSSQAFTFAAGSGCHPSRGIALSRALTEAVQSRLTLIAGSRDDQSAARYEYFGSLHISEESKELQPADSPLYSFADIPSHSHDTVFEDVLCELRQLSRRGCNQVVAVNLTLPEFSIPVARIIIPALQRTARPDPRI